MSDTLQWPVLKHYDSAHLRRIAMPLGGIGTGTVSLGGRGDLRDWEIMNRPAKGFIPKGTSSTSSPFFAIRVQDSAGVVVTKGLEGPLEMDEYEGDMGSPAANHGLPRFKTASFAAAYPLGQVFLSDPKIPVNVHLEAFNPLLPVNADDSGIPVAVLRYVVENPTGEALTISLVGAMPNFIGVDGTLTRPDFVRNPVYVGAKSNRNIFQKKNGLQGVYMKSEGVDINAEAWGTMALVTTAEEGVSYRTTWKSQAGGWGSDVLNFWDDFTADGELTDLEPRGEDMPMASLAVKFELAARSTRAVTFLLTWHFPNRITWSPSGECKDGVCSPEDILTNYYTTQYVDAWDVAEQILPRLADLEAQTVAFVRAFCESDLPEEVKEAALFNLSTLRTQTAFRTSDGRFFGWEGCGNHNGCCNGNCTHVWNYEQTTAFLFGDLALKMREVEFAHATNEEGLMSFRTHLPLDRAQDFGKAAADGQLGCIMKMYRDWQLSGDNETLRFLWPQVKKALAFCWMKGGWDGDQDGVMEGVQHNTMDVEYFGPNPQMEGWYLGALRAAEEMARYLGEDDFAGTCRRLFEQGSRWTDAHLFNGEYYEHEVRPVSDINDVYPGLIVGMGSRDLSNPDYQLGPGCLVDQLVGQYTAHILGLGYLLDANHVLETMRGILKYNYLDSFKDHFNCMRSFVLGDESALLMASYPNGRPENPFSYFTEVMTGFEYTAAVGMIYEGMVDEGVRCIRNIRARYDGRKRSPFDEAECGHHYSRAMAAWAALLALTGFRYSAVTGRMTFAPQPGKFFWSTGYAWGTCAIQKSGAGYAVNLFVMGGKLSLKEFELAGEQAHTIEQPQTLAAGAELSFQL